MWENISETYPQTSQLWNGALLGTIANSMWLLANPETNYYLSWDGPNYNRQDGQGTRATITFLGDNLVCGIRDEKMVNASFEEYNNFNVARFFVGISEELLNAANTETLQYLLDDYQGEAIPIITTAFWSKDDYLTGVKPWPHIYEQGAHIFRKELMPVETAIYEWQEDCGLSDEQLKIVLSLYERRIESANLPIILTPEERNFFLHAKIEGINESRDLLKAIDIIGF